MKLARALLFSWLMVFFLPSFSYAQRQDIFASSSSQFRVDGVEGEDVLKVLAEIKALENRVNVPPVVAPVAKVKPISWNRFSFDASQTYSSTDGALTYLWNFGDGEISRLSNIEHRYKPGKYEASLEVGDANGVIKEIKFPVEVSFWNLNNRALQALIAALAALPLSLLVYSFVKG